MESRYGDTYSPAVMIMPVDPDQFVAAVQPLLEERNIDGLCGLIRSCYQPRQLIDLLGGDHEDARKVAALSLGLVGGKTCVPGLARRLRDADPIVNQMAEHALWSIWIRCGTPHANRRLLRGMHALNKHQFERAAEYLTEATESDPGFAEAFNQRSIVRFLQERFEESVRDAEAAVERMPYHFGAWAGLGHGHAHLGRHAEAAAAYARALEINPHLDCVQEALHELNRAARARSGA